MFSQSLIDRLLSVDPNKNETAMRNELAEALGEFRRHWPTTTLNDLAKNANIENSQAQRTQLGVQLDTTLVQLGQKMHVYNTEPSRRFEAQIAMMGSLSEGGLYAEQIRMYQTQLPETHVPQDIGGLIPGAPQWFMQFAAMILAELKAIRQAQ